MISLFVVSVSGLTVRRQKARFLRSIVKIVKPLAELHKKAFAARDTGEVTRARREGVLCSYEGSGSEKH